MLPTMTVQISSCMAQESQLQLEKLLIWVVSAWMSIGFIISMNLSFQARLDYLQICTVKHQSALYRIVNYFVETWFASLQLKLAPLAPWIALRLFVPAQEGFLAGL